jgi:hypothetical protein
VTIIHTKQGSLIISEVFPHLFFSFWLTF